MSVRTRSIVVVASTQEAIVAVQADQGVGAPVRDADGLAAWGIWLEDTCTTCVPRLEAIAGVTVYDNTPEWRIEAGWVDPEYAE